MKISTNQILSYKNKQANFRKYMNFKLQMFNKQPLRCEFYLFGWIYKYYITLILNLQRSIYSCGGKS